MDTNNEHKPQYISQNIEKVVTDSLSMTTGCIPETSPDHGTSLITTPISSHNISPANASVTLQEKVHSEASTQNLDQEDERKSNFRTRIINETTLRISVPRNYAYTSLTVHTPEIIATSISETITATAQATSKLKAHPWYYLHMDLLHNIRGLHDSTMNDFLSCTSSRQ